MIFYPADHVDILSLAGLEVLYQFCYGGLRRARERVLVVANEGAQYLRELYTNLAIANMPFSSGLFGLAIVDSRGEFKSISPRTRRGRSIEDRLAISSQGLLPDMAAARTVGCAIMSPPGPFGFLKVRGLCEWANRYGVPCVIVFDIIASLKNMQWYLDQGFLIFGWRDEDITGILARDLLRQKTEPQPYSTPVSFLEALNSHDCTRTVDVIAAGDASAVFSEIRTLLELDSWLTHSQDWDWTARVIIRRILREFEKLASPLVLYNRECYASLWAKPLNKSVTTVARLGERIDLEHITEIRKASLLFKDLTTIIESKSNPKFEAALQVVKEALITHTPLLLVFASQPDQRAFERALERLRDPIGAEILERAKIRFESFDTIVRTSFKPEARKCVLTTYPPLKRMSEVYAKLKHSAGDISLLLYKHEAEDLAFYDAMAKAAKELFFSTEMRRKVIEAIEVGTPISYPKIPQVTIQTVTEPHAPRTVSREADFMAALTEFELLEDFDPDELLASVRSGHDRGGRLVLDGIVVIFQGGGSMALRRSSPVNVYREGGRVAVKRADRLGPGDTLILVNHSARKSLNDLILERASRYPKFKMLESLVRIWIRCLREGMRDAGDNPRQTLQKLQSKGSNIQTSVAIRFWRLGLIIGPRDFQDVQRIAEIYAKPELSRQFKSLCKAIAEFRGLRRSLLRGLKDQMMLGADDSLSGLDISPADFRDAIDFLTIAKIERRDEIPMEFFGRVVEYGL